MLGPRCRALITTRDAGLPTSLGGKHHVVELLTDEEAFSLLSQASGVPRDTLPNEAHSIVAECGRLPLAVSLCGALVRRSMSWSSVLEQLQQARIDRIADRHAVEPQHQSVWQAIHVSVEALQPDEKARFLELGVFQPDETTPEPAAATLWEHTGSLDDWGTAELLTTLAERSLVQVSAPAAGTPGPRRFSLHDLIYDYTQRATPDQRGLHHQLLAGYQKKCPDGWPSGPNDGYYFQNLIRHLTFVGQQEEAAAVLLDSTFQERIETYLGLSDLCNSFDFVEKSTHGLTASAGSACFLVLVTKQNHPSWQNEDWNHLRHVQELRQQFKRTSATSLIWLQEGKSAWACASFGMKTLQSLDADLRDRHVENAVAALTEYCENGEARTQLLENARELLASALIQARTSVAVRGPVNKPLGMGGAADTSAYDDDFEAAFLSCLDASLSLQATVMSRFLTAALHFKALYDCNGYPVGAIPFAMAQASERFERLVSGSISSVMKEYRG